MLTSPPRIESARRVTSAIAAAIRPPPSLTVTQWAEANRVLTRETSSEPGPWRTSRTPYLAAIMDALSERHPAQVVVVIAGSQTGKSECGNNWIGYVIDAVGGPMMMVQPSEPVAKKYVQQRLSSVFSTPCVAQKLAQKRGERDAADRILFKEFDGGVFHVVGSNAPAGLASSPIRWLFCDEIDRWVKSAGAEGAPLGIVRRRTMAFPNRKELDTSTPTIAGESAIEVEFLKTDLCFYWVPCPHCTEATGCDDGFQVLQWRPTPEHPGGVVWGDTDEDGAVEERGEAAYQCEHCGSLIAEASKAWMLARGQWRPGGHGEWTHDRRVNDKRVPRNPRAVGFHVSGLYSPWYTWTEARDDFLACRSDPVELQTFVNTVLAECWERQTGESVADVGLLARREDGFGENVPGVKAAVPAAVAVLTAGVDVQADRVEVAVWGWGIGTEAWLIDHMVINGDTSRPPAAGGGVWTELDRALSKSYGHAFAGRMAISATCVDTGHEATNVYGYIKGKSARRIWGVKGKANTRDLVRPVWPPRPGRRNKGGVDLYIVGVDAAKAHLYARFRTSQPGPGFVHFPLWVDGEYVRQLTAEVLKSKPMRGYTVRYWELRKGRRNEALDAAVYAYAALKGWEAQRNTIKAALDSLQPGGDRVGVARRPVEDTGSRRRGFLPGRRADFVRR